MGSESSIPERQADDEFASDRARGRSVSPLPRYEDPRNGMDDDDDLPRFSSTMPIQKTSRSESPDRRARAASQPDDFDPRGEQVQKKKKKKKKHRLLGVAEEMGGSPDRRERDAAVVSEPEEEQSTEQRASKKKKKKRRSSSAQRLPGEEDADDFGYPTAIIRSTPPIGRSPREKKRRKGKNAQERDADAILQPIEEGNVLSDDEGIVEIIPSSIKSPGKRGRRSSGASKTNKRQRLASPFEPIESEFKGFGPPDEQSPPVNHSNGNSRVSSVVEEGQSLQLPTSSGLEALRPRAPSQWTQPSSYQFLHDDERGDEGPKGEREDLESERPSRSDEQHLPKSGREESIEPPLQRSSQPISRGMGSVSSSAQDDINPPQSGQSDAARDSMDVDSLPPSKFENDDIESVMSGEEVRNPRSKDLSIESESEAAGDTAEGVADTGDVEMPDAEEPSAGDSTSEENRAAKKISTEDSWVDSEAGGADETPSAGRGILANEKSKGHQRNRRQVPDSPVRQTQKDLQSDENEQDEEEAAGITPRANANSLRGGRSDEGPGKDHDESAHVEPATQRTPTRIRLLRKRQANDIYELGVSPAKANRERPANEEVNAASSPPRSSVKTPGSRKANKRKPKTPYFAREEDENTAAFSELPGDEVVAPPEKEPNKKEPKKKAAKKSKPKTPAPDGDAAAEVSEDKAVRTAKQKGQYLSGALTAHEQQQVRNAVEGFRESENITQEEIIQIIHVNPQQAKGQLHRQLWATVVEACTTRPRQKLIHWCRQNFHNFVARGTWTQEQDDELMEMIERHGKKWSHIGGLINRLSTDCRDRYRNHLVCRDTVKRDYWSKEEEEQLYDAVQLAVNKIREDKTLKKVDDETIEGLINWQLISEAMGSTRNRLQCMKKWKLLGESGVIPERVASMLPPSSSLRLAMVRKDLKKIDLQDKFQLVSYIRDSEVAKDSKIKWNELVKGVFGNQYERKAIMVIWARLRGTVPDADTMKTHEIARYLCDVFEAEGNFGSGDESGVESAIHSRRSSPEKSGRVMSAGEVASARKARGYRTPRLDASRSASGSVAGTPARGTPAGRLSEQAMARAFRSKKLLSLASRSREDTQEDGTDVIEESAQEDEDVNAPPREPTPPSDDEDVTAPRSMSTDRRERAPSVDLGLDDGTPLPITPSLRPSPQKPRSQARTYSIKNKHQDLRASATKRVKALKAVIDSSQGSEAEAQNEDGAQTPRRSKKKRASEASPATNGPKSRKGKGKETAMSADDEENDLDKTPRQLKRLRPGSISTPGAELSSPNKRRRSGQEERSRDEGSAPHRWTPINNMPESSDQAKAVASQPVDARSDLSSDMDDMDDIPAKLPVGTPRQQEDDY